MASHYYQGRYHPEHPEKYAGNVHEIIYRSSWERQVMIRLDRSDSVMLWNSEGLSIPYRSPLDGELHRYFPDFVVKVRDRTGTVKTHMLEIKPHAQTQIKSQTRRTRKFLQEVATYAVNTAKWKAAQEFCTEQGWEFHLITEKDTSFA